MDNIQEYTEEIQQLFLNFLITDPELFVRVNNIIEPYMFNRKFQSAVKFLKEHAAYKHLNLFVIYRQKMVLFFFFFHQIIYF